MKVIIAPSKTMQKTSTKASTEPLFKPQQEALLNTLKTFDQSALLKLFQIKDEALASLNYERFQHFKPQAHALYAYTGHQFKHLDANSLPTYSIEYLNQRLLIMSGLYGLVRPSDKIGLYRLPMGLKINGTPLKTFWKDALSTYLEGQTVLNLASKEYSDALDKNRVNLITIDFYQDKQRLKKAPAMIAKKMRGLMVRQLALKNVTSPETIKTLEVDAYRFDEDLSNASHYAFIKA